MSHGERVHVAVGVVMGEDGSVLIAKRPTTSHQGGLWEFPGGKVAAGETAEAGLARELDEEIGVIPADTQPLIRIPYDYPDKRVLLDVYRVVPSSQEVTPRQGQALRWVMPEALPEYAFPAANTPIVTAARLPARYAISPEPANSDDADWWQGLSAALDAGHRLFQYRVAELAGRGDHAAEAVSLIHKAGARCLINGDSALAARIGADGVHLKAQQLAQAIERPPLEWVAASCHGPQDLAKAASLGIDFAVLGPVAATATHPDQQPLGWQRFSHYVEAQQLPVYALGGLGDGDLRRACQAGAQGVAAIRAFWQP